MNIPPPKQKRGVRNILHPPSLAKIVRGEVLLKLPSVKIVVNKEGSKSVRGEVLLKLPIVKTVVTKEGSKSVTGEALLKLTFVNEDGPPTVRE